MDKYRKWFYEQEEVSKRNNEEKIDEMMNNLKAEIQRIYEGNIATKLLGFSSFELFECIIKNLSLFTDDFRNYVVNNVINNLDEYSLINLYNIYLCYYLTLKDENKINIIINSFNQTGLIQNVKFDKENKNFILKTNNEDIIYFENDLENIEDVLKLNKYCHSTTYCTIKEISKNDLIYATTIKLNNLIGGKQYHSFVVYEGDVYDSAHNIVMNFEDYKKLYNPEVIMLIEGGLLQQNIKELKNTDFEYKDSDGSDLLNYAMHLEMKKYKKL